MLKGRIDNLESKIDGRSAPAQRSDDFDIDSHCAGGRGDCSCTGLLEASSSTGCHIVGILLVAKFAQSTCCWCALCALCAACREHLLPHLQSLRAVNVYSARERHAPRAECTCCIYATFNSHILHTSIQSVRTVLTSTLFIRHLLPIIQQVKHFAP